MAAHIVLPWVHRIFANLKVSALGVDHGLRRKHVQSYLDQFVFRFNRRRTRHAAFRSLLGIAAGARTLSYKLLILTGSKGKVDTSRKGFQTGADCRGCSWTMPLEAICRRRTRRI